MFYIGLGALFIGMFMIVKGWTSGVKGATIGKGLLMIASGLSILVGASHSKGRPKGSPELIVVGILGILLVIALFVVKRVKNADANKELKQKNAEVIGANPLDRFFVECVLAGADDFSQEKNIQRAKLLADKYALSYPSGIEALYQQGLEAHKVVSRRLVLNHLEEKRADERNQFEELNKYADLVGKAKRIAMLSDRAAELREKAKNQQRYADMLMRSGQQKERNWATWGGIANGIAGVGAGVSTALDVQIQNMKIREENERRRQAALPGYFAMTDSASGNLKNAESIMKEIENFKLKLISEDSKETLMTRISFANTDVLVSETGSAMVCTSASLDPQFMIFGDVPAIVDGTILAKIYDGERLCGTAQLVLPVYGLGQDIPLNGICLDCCEPGKNYTVEFAAKNLWAMEK